MTRDERQLKKRLTDLTRTVAGFLGRLDEVMKTGESLTRGETIAELCNGLDLANDAAMRFGLNMSFKQIAAVKKKKGEKRCLRS